MLQALGIDNYGINNVVGGFMGIIAIVTSTMTASISRYLTYGLGKGDMKQLQITFSTSMNVLFAIALIYFLIGETVGLWFVNHELEFPPGRLHAANWVYQLSIFSGVLGFISLPYNAIITAHEKMDVYAYMTIVDVVVKLALCFLLFIIPFDRLIFFSVFVFIIALGKRIFFGWYCTRKFPESHYIRVFDKSMFKEISSFAGWQFFGNTAWILNTQGANMLINIFFGVAFNAARGIAQSVENAVMGFVSNFSTAFTPQVIKSYAEGDLDYMYKIMERGSKFSIFLMLFFMIPLEFEVEEVLKIWLGEYPAYSPLFLRLSLISTAVLLIGDPFLRGINATGNIRVYQIVITCFGFIAFPLTWLAFKLGFPVQSYYYIFILIYFGVVLIRSYFVQKIVGYPVSQFFNKVLLPLLYTTIISIIPVAIVYHFMNEGFIRLIVVTLTSIISVTLTVGYIGMTHGERNYIIGIIRRSITKLPLIGSK